MLREKARAMDRTPDDGLIALAPTEEGKTQHRNGDRVRDREGTANEKEGGE